ncbi:MAG TPA: phosphotransferase [Ktedonobacterales bacterium]
MARLVERLAVGLRQYVFAVTTDDDRSVVVRLATGDSAGDLAGGVYWHERLRDVGAPLAQLLHADLAPTEGIPYMLLERLPGQDLGLVYDHLTRQQRFVIAADIVAIQRAVAQLPRAHGFGFACSYDDPNLRASWYEVALAHVERSRQRISAAGVTSAHVVSRVRACVEDSASYLRAVEPIAFLDDTTTKNVLIFNGALSGIVDTDNVCFGDSLFTLALTRVALLAHGQDPEYADHWRDLLALDGEQRRALDVYTAMFLLDFLGELGHRFNRDEPVAYDAKYKRRLERLLSEALDRV